MPVAGGGFQRKKIRLLVRCHRAWSNNLVFLLLLIAFQWPVLLWGSYHRYHLTHLGVMALDSFLLIAGCFYYVAMLQAMPWHKLRQGLFTLSIAVTGTLFLLEVFTICEYGTMFGEGLITVILETNPNEMAEYLSSFWREGFISVLLTVGFMVLCYRLHRRWKKHRRKLPRKILFLVQPEIIGAFLAVVYIRPIGGEAPFDLPITQIASAFCQTLEDMRHYDELRQKMTGKVQILENNSSIPYVVLILGESTQRNFLHLYDYPLPNTPHLDELSAKGELAVFTDVISPKQGTVFSLREMFTFHDWESDKEWYQCGNLLDVLKKAGYTTWWLSNQESFGVWGNMGKLLADCTDHVNFTQWRSSQDDFGLPDEALFPLLDESLAETEGKNFFVLHLMGCHVLYELRYPKTFRRFTAGDIEEDVPVEWKEEIAAYNNAVLYNDFIVSGIIDRFRDMDAIVIYLSDHGENVHDEGSALVGHAYAEPNRYLYEIPFVVWASDVFRQNHGEKWRDIQAAVSNHFMTDDLIHALLGMMDIRTAGYDERKNLFTSEFDAGRPRLIGGKNYDRDLRYRELEK